MPNTKGAGNIKNPACVGKQSFLPPKSPFPSISPSYMEYSSGPCAGSKGIPKPREGHRQHQRTSSESFLIEEQPSWLDDLLNEPETPIKRGAHRRSSSDSFAYLDAANFSSSIDNLVQGGMHIIQDFDRLNDAQHAFYYTDTNSFGSHQNRVWESPLSMAAYPSNLPLQRNKNMTTGPSTISRDGVSSNAIEKQNKEDPNKDLKDSSEKKDGPHAKHSQLEMDPKRVKQQFAQRSRVRKLQYIAELERNVQSLEADHTEVSAELEFLDKQNLILNLENKALKQRLDSLAQEHLIKRLQHEMLERETARLRALYHQQQQKQLQPAPIHRRSSSRDLDSQLANLSLMHSEANAGKDPVTGSLRI